jgi:hypothetical protein
MEVLNHEEMLSNSGIAGTDNASIDQRDTDPLSSSAPTQQPPGTVTGNTTMARAAFTNGATTAGDEGDDNEFTAGQNRSLFRSFLRYTRAILALLGAFVLDLTNANNQSIVSKIVRIVATTFTYGTIYTGTTGVLLWTIAYLMDHGWYLLAVTCSMVTLLLCGIFLALCEWMWRWQGRVVSYVCGGGGDNGRNIGYNRLRSVNILDDDDMEDDLTFRGWVKQIIHALVTSLIWSLYCALNVKIDFWITDQYLVARPSHYAIELRLVNCFEAAPVLLGAAVLLYFAYPSFYRWNFSREPSSSLVAATGTVDTIAAPFATAEDTDNDRFNEVTMGAGMQSLII